MAKIRKPMAEKTKAPPVREKTEHEIQREFVVWFRRSCPGAWIYATPNGGGRSLSQGLRLKAEGVSPGVPDICIPAMFCYLEFKTRTGRESEEQRAWAAHLRLAGYTCELVRSVEDAQKISIALAKKYAIPLLSKAACGHVVI